MTNKEPKTARSNGEPCSALLAELEAALRRDACIIARIARSGRDPKDDPAFARYCALEDAFEAERRYSANVPKLSDRLGGEKGNSNNGEH